MERVSIINGKIPILIVAPHGYEKDDEQTALIAEYIANKIGAYAVINRGWERAEEVDFWKDKADCNNINHCFEDVVKEEILDPILRYKSRILLGHSEMYVFWIHGMSDDHRKISGDDKMDLVIGYGAGKVDRFSCDPWRKDLFIHFLENEKITTYEGSKSGRMSGWANSNMNQLFRTKFFNPKVHSMQIEIIHELRRDEEIATITADYLAHCMLKLINDKNTLIVMNKKNKCY